MHTVAETLIALADEGMLVVGIGNPDRGDDAAGLLLGRVVAERLETEYIEGGEVPENYTAEMRNSPVSTVLLVDAVDSKSRPGMVGLFDPDDFADSTVSTHKCSMSILAKLITHGVDKNVLVLGIQPCDLRWGQSLSEAVTAGVEEFGALLGGSGK